MLQILLALPLMQSIQYMAAALSCFPYLAYIVLFPGADIFSTVEFSLSFLCTFQQKLEREISFSFLVSICMHENVVGNSEGKVRTKRGGPAGCSGKD